MKASGPHHKPISIKHRTDAVTQFLRGEDIEIIAADIGVAPREIETWTREFCRSGEMRLRQMPDNFFERCLVSAEKLVPLATLISVIIAVTIFVQGQRKEALQSAHISAMERESRVRDAYTALDDRYLDYVKLCLDHPDLDVFDTPIVHVAPSTVEQKRRESMVLSILMSIFERAYLMYGTPNDAFERNQWSAWSAYMKSWATRGNFRTEWASSKVDFDPTFVTYFDSLIHNSPATAPSLRVP